jgi:hypothetical protein
VGEGDRLEPIAFPHVLPTIHLNITAQPGPDNLLGNLLRAVAHLLDGNASGNAIANLLNRIFGLLG